MHRNRKRKAKFVPVSKTVTARHVFSWTKKHGSCESCPNSGRGRWSRTTDNGVKVRCLTAWLYPHIKLKMGRVVGIEPTHNGATIRRVNRFTTPATSGIMWDVPHNEMYYTMLFIFSQIFLLSVSFLLPFYIFSLFK